MRRGRLVLLSIVSALLVEATGWGQERPNGLFATTPLSVSAGYDHNFIVKSGALSDSVAILTSPTVAWIKSTHRMRFSADYQAEFELFERYQELNAWNHASTLRYSYRINPRWSADAGNSLLSTSDSSRRLAESQFLLPRGRYQQNSLYAGLKYRLDRRTAFMFRFDNAVTALTLPGPRSNLSDQMASAGTMTVDHTVNRHHSVTGSYSYLHVRPLDRAGSAGYSYPAVHSVNSGYMYTVDSRLNFRLTGGVVRGREFAYTAGGAVEKYLGGLWIMAGYQRYLSFFGGFTPARGAAGETIPFANGLLPDSLFQAVSVRVRGKLTKRVGLEFSGQRGRSNYGDQPVRSLIGQSRVDYQLNQRFILFARADYYGQNVSQFSESRLARRRYFGGLEIVLSRPPEQEGAARRRGRMPAESTQSQPAETQGSEER